MHILKKYFTFIICCVLIVSSAYAIINTEFKSSFAAENAVQDDNFAPDTTKKFPISKVKVQSAEDVKPKIPLDAPMPDNVRTELEYDVRTGNYVFRSYVGNMEIATPFSMNESEYFDFSGRREMQSYWREKNSTLEKNNEDKFSVTDMKFDIGPADKVFGPGGVQVRTQGSAELVFGIRQNRIDNPALTERMRKSTTPDFDMKIQMNVTGTVGDKLNFGMNYNTESTFDFDQKMIKMGFKGKEDDIIQNIQAGNVSLPLTSSLISGSTSLFGIRTDLKFGKLQVSAIATQQESETKTVSTKGGAQMTEFSIGADAYDENRHFFLAHHFRESYETSMAKLPFVASGITINRIEVWVTNKRGNFEQARNIVAFMDMAEPMRIDNNYWSTGATSSLPSNSANKLYGQVTALEGVRNVQIINNLMTQNFGAFGIYGGQDYEKIESARRLDASEYTLNSSLGILSLRNTLNPDDILGVAFEYTYGGKVYQVGEFSTDGIASPNALMVKLLKSTNQSPGTPMWDLMLKNVYSLGAMQLQKEDFDLRIVYRNDSVGTELQYITEGDIQNQLLLRVMNLDRLDARENPNPDGRFDFIEGFTALSSSGRIIFPVLEPFGEHLARKINNPAIADKYVFRELYDSTLVVAQEMSEKNKFRLVGKYKASSGSEIRLNAMNVPRGSVTVTAGGATLVENVDYTVDYNMGTVNILNQSLIESGTNINVKLENQSMFSMQRKSLVGTNLLYQFNKDFSVGGTIMHLSERPLTAKVNTGNEPISNTIWGMNTAWRTESQWLTNMIDKLPFVNATKPSTIAFNAEFAQLIPGHSKVIGRQGLAYIDDFESTKSSININYPMNWYLASTPYSPSPDAMFPEAAFSDDVRYGYNRALLAWYFVDPVLNARRGNRLTPTNLLNNKESQSNHYTRDIQVQEVFPNRNFIPGMEAPRLTVMNLSYYPRERGPYNLDVDGMDENGFLRNPEKRWGGIMRKLDVTDFETANVEYIEFWMMDPFIYDKDKTQKGGELYFNLGDISEDILKDGKKSFEHGLPLDDDPTKFDITKWGRVPRSQSNVRAFDNTPGARQKQDVGLNGLSTENEFKFPTFSDYVNSVRAKLTPQAQQRMLDDPFSILNDPAGDNYSFYKSTYYDNINADILTRYKRFNGTEGNSPDAIENQNENYPTTATSLPDIEDINGDNTLSEFERYFQYKVNIKHGELEIGRNYVVDAYTTNVSLANGNVEPVTWYQFKIPIRDVSPENRVGNIRNFKSIRFVRMFLTGFEEEAHLRFATLDLVRGEWRRFNKDLFSTTKPPTTIGALDVQAVNIEENSDKSPVNYVLPPGVDRVVDPGQPAHIKLNEQSMVLKVNDLAPGDARAVYRNTGYDMRQYKRLQMFVHAEKFIDDATNLQDNDLAIFVRLGSDMTNNYYEYEIPLRLTPHARYNDAIPADRAAVWPIENMLDVAFEAFTRVKNNRNKAKNPGNVDVQNYKPYVEFDLDKPNNKITVLGNPSIANVENIMIGVRNRNNDGPSKSGEIWINELRMSEFDHDGGSAALANLAIGLSDIAAINVSGRYESAGFGGIESNVLDRRMDDLYQLNFAANLDAGRFLPEKAKIQLPTYFSYSNETLTPKYNPLDEDILMKDALANAPNRLQHDSLLLLSQTVSTSKSFNVTGARINIRSKNPQFYDPANVTVTYAYTATEQHNTEIERNLVKQERAAINYSYSFQAKPWEPFKASKALSKPAFKIIQEFNLNYLPQSISFNTDMNRHFTQVKLRDFGGVAIDPEFSMSHSKDFMWNRQFDIKYDLTKSLKFSLQTAMNANIEEPYYVPEFGRDYYDEWRDEVWKSIRKLGQPYTYQQVFSATWNLPINKIPIFDWITSNASYNSTYGWNRMAKIEGDTEIGNIASGMGSWQLDGQFNMETLYNKIGFLRDANKRNNTIPNPMQQKFEPRTYKQVVKLEADKKIVINHRLGSESFRLTALDKNGNPTAIPFKTVNATTIELNPRVSADSVQLSIVTTNPADRSFAAKTFDFTAGLLMMVRRASFTYRETNNMVMPGFKQQAGFMGQEKTANGMFAPGYDFVFGFFNESTIERAMQNDWLVSNESVINPITMANTSDFDFRSSLEPIRGFKVELSARRYIAANTSIQYMFAGMPRTFNGSYNITQIGIKTAFERIGDASNNYQSNVYDKFLSNRQVIADRLNAKYVGTKYPTTGFFEEISNVGGTDYDASKGAFGLNSSDVLIPAFLAAYTGRDVRMQDTNPFPNLASILPNWRMNYDGLTRIPWVREKFRSVSITHAYTFRYSVGSYTSFSTWVPMSDDNSALGYVRDVQSNNPMPASPFDIAAVSVNEQFSPLIGINAALKNSMTAKVEMRKQRNLSLNLSSTQLIEATSDEYVIGVGYILKDFDVILKMKNDQQSRVKNDLKLNLDVSYKDIKTLMRKIDENLTQASSGNKVFSLKFIADYVFSSKVNIQMFYDRQMSTPLISSTFPVSSTNFGVSFKFMLTR